MSKSDSRKKLKDLLINLHQGCIEFDITTSSNSLLSFRSYYKTLLLHLVDVIKSPTRTPKLRNRAIMILLTIILSGITLSTTVSYTGYKIIQVFKNLIVNSYSRNGRNGKPVLRRTRSQMMLDTGARVMYIHEDNNMNLVGSNRDITLNSKLGNISGMARTNLNNIKQSFKKIFIPPRDEDLFEHDKFLFKNVEMGKLKKSQLFYSKFLSQLSVLSKILIPTIVDKNSILLFLQIFFLILRTYLSLLVARLDGRIVRDIISGRLKNFIVDIGYWFLIAFPASYTNAAIKLLQRKLSLNFRVNLTRYIHDLYLDKKLSFYKIIFDYNANSSIIKNIDNSITNDIAKFCDASTSIFANIAKPVIDLIFFSVYLRDNIGSIGVAGIFINYFVTGYILRAFAPPLGRLASDMSASDGDYYNYHLNLINNCEEISFYQGTNVETTKVKQLYYILMDKMLIMDKSKFNYNMIEGYILKYTWSGLGYVFASFPIIFTTIASGINSEEQNMKQFIVNKRLMLSLADAGSRLMHSIKDISQLTGYTNRIFTLISTLHRVHSNDFAYGAYIVGSNGTGSMENLTGAQSKSFNLKADKVSSSINSSDSTVIRGTIQKNFNGLRFENIDVIIPSTKGQLGSKLIKKLTFQIPPFIAPISSMKINSLQDLNTSLSKLNISNKNSIYDMTLPFSYGPGSSLLILGPNSCGKSSIQRIIAEIWPIYNKNGLMSIPAEDELMCIPQRPYFSKGGTFRDQIIYPMGSDEFFDRGLKDKLLVQILADVKLEYLLKRDKGWSYFDAVFDWKDVLSGGEKQRMNFARILFHKPRFVILDEATNAISVDMEDYLFKMLKKYRFNFISISQRPSLVKYHDLLLEISEDKEGTWTLQTLGTDEAISSIDNEIEELEAKLMKVQVWEEERRELQKRLEVI
ncbi:hypothetical protein TPHA_0D01170 [Tetrapisispora phaffii CBS 4417]|uniref:ABC transporter domain-containing protein n=1 Tax=Tetrapisispora phaffii (strain ATCC 24235 / CBS 4417 / NBRC 1672 / NRRL Y-8282 / UCD 70-5) TaxID=1071381 RepID=G8BSD7_TETPH|nr:hypothetical protein TPHA_0D01170 [Tetrapisispora phaffii CBS 4417]CCE62758.1 hypothetical protein TPHA_0D01170 [Tetrapisispora phaffii CBS 4417]